MGNPALPGNTQAGGLTWAEFLATQLNTSLTLTFNFAVAGATVDNSIVAAYMSTVPSIIEQVTTWSRNLGPKPTYAPWTAETALFAIWIGVNDVGNSYTQSGEEARLNRDLNRYFEQLTVLYKAGARNFALLNIPRQSFHPGALCAFTARLYFRACVSNLPSNATATQKTPQMKSQAKVADLVAAITNWNGQLPGRIDKFKAAGAPDANITLVDTQAPFDTAIANPKDYGAPNADCTNANGKSCLWFNSYHPGTAIQKLVGQTVATAFKGTFF